MAQRVHPAGKLGGLSGAVEKRLESLQKEDVVRRIWSLDHTVWKPDPTEITNRQGWLNVADWMLDSGRLTDLRSFAGQLASEGYRAAVLLGMGGSSLGPAVLFQTFGQAPGALQLIVLDSTDPRAIKNVEDRLDLGRTVFIVASKSGTTLETFCHFAYFWDKIPDGRHFVAITDPGTRLEALANERGFRRVFSNPPDIGGRYSVLSYFGIVPATLMGVDLAALLESAHEMMHACHNAAAPAENPGAWLGAVLGEAAVNGRDKLTLALAPSIRTLGWWVEQLIAESTGKEGKGILPVEGEPIGPPAVYGDDRLFVAVGDVDGLAALESAGHPVVRIPFGDKLGLGGEFFRWEFATAVAGHILGINPFDQPNVQSAKDATERILQAGRAGEQPQVEDASTVLASVRPRDYIAIQAYLPPSPETDQALLRARVVLRDRHRVATTAGYGPRYLHSTGQLHKGGANNGVFLQVVADDPGDLPIPDQPFTFGTLEKAQALGDLESLLGQGRRATRVTLEQLEEVRQ
jgi:glucose-6-phosphate isomerase